MNHLLVQGDARRLPLADGSVHCVVCSPPYWGLRDYGTAQWMGGDPGCDHTKAIEPSTEHFKAPGYKDAFRNGNGRSNHENEPAYRDVCGKCGARRIDSQLGLEATPELFVAAMVRVFREVWRVLRDDGTCWINLGDSYGSRPGGSNGGWDGNNKNADGTPRQNRQTNTNSIEQTTGLKPKDLVGIPWRVAFALQADGWYLRSDIIWAKPNPMPESVCDRPTKSHEYIFLLSKRERYYFDSEAVREKMAPDSEDRYAYAFGGTKAQEQRNGDQAFYANRTRITGMKETPAGRNIRSVWTIPSEAYPGAHFATFPRKLVAPCVKAGTSARGVCPTCGAPWERVTERSTVQGIDYEGKNGDMDPNHSARRMLANVRARRLNGEPHDSPFPPALTIGWRPTCSHTAAPIPATVFDPFCGSGTTGVVALALRRNFIGTDLSAKYLTMAERRISRPHARVARAAKHEPMPLFPDYVE